MEDYSEVRPARAYLRHGYGLSCSALGALTERLKNIQLSLLLLDSVAVAIAVWVYKRKAWGSKGQHHFRF